MHKLAALVVTAALGVATLGLAKPAEARVYVDVGVGLPGVALVAPPLIAYPPYYYRHYYGPGYVRDGYGYGYRGYGYWHHRGR